MSRPWSDRRLELTGDAELGIDRVAFSELVSSFGSPLHVIDLQAVDHNVASVTAACTTGRVYSSYKTNPIPAVLSRLHAGGIGAEVISPFEWWLARRLGVEPDEIIYNGPAKSDDSLFEAANDGALLVNVNSVSDLARIERAAELASTPMNTGVRISLAHMWGGQFGIDAHSEALLDVVRRAVASPWTNLIGVHAHSGFPLTTAVELSGHVESVLDVVDRVRAETGWLPRLLDLGGSVTCPTVHPPGRTDVIDLAQAIASTESIVDDHFAVSDRPQVAFEPGKALAADVQLLLTTVLAVDESDGLATATLDVGVGLAEPLRSEHHDMYNATNPSGRLRPTQLRGADVAGDDSLGDPVLLADVRVGDVIVVMDTGAYFVPFSRAASLLRPAIVTLDRTANPAVTIARRREDAAHAHRHDRPTADRPSAIGE